MHKLDCLLKPKSIAVIGASREKGKLGRMILDNILKSNFKGKIYPVNPKANKIGGLKCYKNVNKIPCNVDLAVISIPGQFVYQVVKECADKKVGSVVIISSGFSETGQDGLEAEYQISEILKKHNIPLLGPNCLGVISTFSNLNTTFAINNVNKGGIAFLSQSGALGTAGLDFAEEKGIGFSHFISLGNKPDLSENDFLKYFFNDKNVNAMAFYLEDFANGKEFIEICSDVHKPIIVLKPGKSEAAQKALGSHTGSLAQDDLIITAALEQARVLRVHSINELFNVMLLLSSGKELEGNKVAIVTNAGGPGVLTCDAIELTSLRLAKITNRIQQKLALKLPAASNVQNPIDVLGDALADRYKFALQSAVNDKEVNAVIVILTPQTMTEIEKTAQVISDIAKKSDKFVIPAFIGGKEVKKGIKSFRDYNIPYFTYPEEAAQTLSYIYESKQLRLKDRKINGLNLNGKRFQALKLLKGKEGVIDTYTTLKILKKYNIPVLQSSFPQDIAALKKFIEELGFPVVMKLIHPSLLHKTDVNAVRLDIDNFTKLENEFSALSRLAKKMKLKDFKIQIQPLVKNALELIIGVKLNKDQYGEVKGKKILRKKGFGHTVLFGMGGIYTEIYKDISLRITPLFLQDINEMMEETKVSEILKGARGKKYNIDKIKQILAKLSELVEDNPNISELDINPLFAKGDDVWVVDAKMIVE